MDNWDYDKQVIVKEWRLRYMADKIRKKTFVNDELTLDDMIDKIEHNIVGDSYIEELYFDESQEQIGSVRIVNVHVIRHNQFEGCLLYGVDFVNTDNSLKKIEQYAFGGCESLEHFSINGKSYNNGVYIVPDSVEEIGQEAFARCMCMKELVLPANLKRLGVGVASACFNLEKITFRGTPTFIDSDALAISEFTGEINVPWAEGEVANAPWGATEATINYNVSVE